MDYQLLASDIDGTLLCSKHLISKENIDAISKASKMGVKFVICSGRADTTLLDFFEKIGLNKKGNYIISFNGSELLSVETGEILRKVYMNRDSALKIVEMAKTLNEDATPLIYRTSKHILLEQTSEYINKYLKTSRIEHSMVNYSTYIKEDVSKLLFIGERNALKNVHDFLLDKLPEDINMFSSSGHILEFTGTGGEKGTAMAFLADMLGIPINKTIGIGDNYNDISLIEKAGLGVAVANAVPELRLKADYVTKATNDESAVAEVINKFILKV